MKSWRVKLYIQGLNPWVEHIQQLLGHLPYLCSVWLYRLKSYPEGRHLQTCFRNRMCNEPLLKGKIYCWSKQIYMKWEALPWVCRFKPHFLTISYFFVVLLSQFMNLECVTAQWFRGTCVFRIACNLVAWGTRDMELNIFNPKPSEVSEQWPVTEMVLLWLSCSGNLPLCFMRRWVMCV